MLSRRAVMYNVLITVRVVKIMVFYCHNVYVHFDSRSEMTMQSSPLNNINNRGHILDPCLTPVFTAKNGFSSDLSRDIKNTSCSHKLPTTLITVDIYWAKHITQHSYAKFFAFLYNFRRSIRHMLISNRQWINWVQRFWFSGHGSLNSNLIGQNGYFGGMRPLRDSGSKF